jgi:glutaredoxin 3
VEFTEFEITREPGKRHEMLAKAGGRSTVPQIFIGERHVGGCDDLYALDSRGELDRMLAA